DQEVILAIPRDDVIEEVAVPPRFAATRRLLKRQILDIVMVKQAEGSVGDHGIGAFIEPLDNGYALQALAGSDDIGVVTQTAIGSHENIVFVVIALNVVELERVVPLVAICCDSRLVRAADLEPVAPRIAVQNVGTRGMN